MASPGPAKLANWPISPKLFRRYGPVWNRVLDRMEHFSLIEPDESVWMRKWMAGAGYEDIAQQSEAQSRQAVYIAIRRMAWRMHRFRHMSILHAYEDDNSLSDYQGIWIDTNSVSLLARMDVMTIKDLRDFWIAGGAVKRLRNAPHTGLARVASICQFTVWITTQTLPLYFPTRAETKLKEPEMKLEHVEYVQETTVDI